MAIAFDFNLLPVNVYIKLIIYLSVNDIEHLGESGLDDRTKLAFVNLRHAMVYADNENEAENYWFPKLPNTIKTVDVCLRHGSVEDLTVVMGQMFPNIEKLPVTDWLNCLKYVDSLNSPTSKLNYIGYSRLGNQRHVDQIRKLISMSPGLKHIYLYFALDALFESDLFSKCTSLEQLTFSVQPCHDDADDKLRKLILSLPPLKLLTITGLPSDEDIAHRFLTVCTEQKFKTELNAVYEHAVQLERQFCPLVTKLRIYPENVMSMKSRLKDFTNLRELTIHTGSSELFLALCDPEITSKPFTIPSLYARLSTEDEMDIFQQLLEVRGGQVKEMSLDVQGPIASRLMKISGSVNNFRLDGLTIYIANTDQPNMITVEDINHCTMCVFVVS